MFTSLIGLALFFVGYRVIRRTVADRLWVLGFAGCVVLLTGIIIAGCGGYMLGTGVLEIIR